MFPWCLVLMFGLHLDYSSFHIPSKAFRTPGQEDSWNMIYSHDGVPVQPVSEMLESPHVQPP